MVLEMNIDLVNRKIEFGAPSTQWWSQLATAVAGGLAFATVLTLVLTPCLLMLGRERKPALIVEEEGETSEPDNISPLEDARHKQQGLPS